MDLKNKEIISNEEIFDELPFDSVNNEIISPQENLTEEIFDELPFESPVNNNIIFQVSKSKIKQSKEYLIIFFFIYIFFLIFTFCFFIFFFFLFFFFFFLILFSENKFI